MKLISNTIPDNKIEDIIPLLPLQKTLLYSMLSHPTSYRYYEQWQYTYRGPVDVAKMINAWRLTRKKFDLLRGVFHWEGIKEPVLIIFSDKSEKERIYDLTNKKVNPDNIAWEEWNDRVDIRTNPVRFAIVILSDDHCEWIINSNHILFDGWSNAIIMNYLLQSYINLCSDLYKKDEIEVKYRECFLYAKKGFANNEHENFWEKYLDGYKPRDYEVIQKGKENSRVLLPIEQELMDELYKLSINIGCSIPVILYAGWALMTSIKRNCSEVLIGVTTSGRKLMSEKKAKETVGLLIGTVPMRVFLKPNIKIERLLKEIQQDLLALEDHVFVDPLYLNKLVPDLNKIYSEILTIQNYPVNCSNNSIYSLTFHSSIYEPGAEIATSIKTFMDRMDLEISYYSDIYSRKDIKNKFSLYFDILKKITNQSNSTVKDVCESLNI